MGVVLGGGGGGPVHKLSELGHAAACSDVQILPKLSNCSPPPSASA